MKYSTQTPSMLKLGKLIKYYRIVAGMTQRDLAARIGKITNTVATWEQGRQMPKPTMIRPLIDALGMSETQATDFKVLHAECWHQLMSYHGRPRK